MMALLDFPGVRFTLVFISLPKQIRIRAQIYKGRGWALTVEGDERTRALS